MQPSIRTAVAGSAIALAAFGAHSAALVGLTSANEIARFDTANIAGATRVAISGLAAGDSFVGIDLRPKDNTIYGVTLSNKIYTVNELTGAATFVAMLSSNVIDPTLGYGIDFNPSADFANGSSLRLVSSAGSNFAINAGTGVVGNAASNIGTGYTAVAYSNAVPLPTAAPASTALYYINSDANTLSMASSGFNAPTITTIGPLGVDVLKANGFELLGNGQAFAAFNVDAGSLATGIYSIDLVTGAASLIGTYSGTLSGLTISAVPEPQTYLLMAGGLLGIAGWARRRRA